MRERLPRIAFVFACAVSLALPLAAQSSNGTINGRVLDPSNKVIGGAQILVINDATGVKYSGKTNEDGIYVVPNLPPGSYRLQVSKMGFKTLIKPDIVLNIEDALAINFTLPVGAVFETVTVEGGASMINTTDASVSTVVDQTYVKNMPLNGRSFQDLILLTPGVITDTPQGVTQGNLSGVGVAGEFSVNGQRTESNYYTVDGVSANVGAAAGLDMISGGGGPSGSVPAATALGTTQALVSVDDLQEFRVESSSYSAEYGRNPGGQFAFETKSGTNRWHGTAYDYLRNGALDAQDWFSDYFGQPQPALRQNDFGGTLGGPVNIPGLYDGQSRTFFFVSYEGLRLTAPEPARVSYVPDSALRASAPPALAEALNAFPVQSPSGIDDTTTGFAQFIGTWSNPSSIDATSVRFDHTVNDRLKLFFRFSNATSSSQARVQSSPAEISGSVYTLRTYTVGSNSALTDHLGNTFRLNYSSNEVTGETFISTLGGNTPIELTKLVGTDASVLLFYGGHVLSLDNNQESGAQRQWNVVDIVNRLFGRHELKFGADYRRLAPVARVPALLAYYYYFSRPDVQTNSATQFSVSSASAYPLYVNFSAFAEDEWKISRRLTLSLGLRWEVNPAPGITGGLKPYTLQGSGPDDWSLAPQGTPLWHTTWYNLAPRLGAAYVLRAASGWETVVRSGGGVFFDTGQQLGSLSFGGPGFRADLIQTGSFPTSLGVPTITNPPVAPYNVDGIGFAHHLQLPYSLQWNASIEQGIGKSQALSASYVGSHAARLLKQAMFSPASNPNASSFFFISNGLTSDYDAAQIQFRRRLSGGLTALASYVMSHCIDYGSHDYSIGYERGNCEFDVRHSFSAAFSYDVPNMGQHSLGRSILRSWGLDDRITVRSSFPVNLVGQPIFDPVTGNQASTGINFVSGQAIYLYGSNCDSVLQALGDLQPGQGCTGGRAINPCAFVLPDGTTNTNCPANPAIGSQVPRNFARGFGAWQMNLAIRREFPIYEALKLQFRAEAFNVFNHPNFGSIDPNFGSPTFGQAISTLANSFGGLSPQYQSGGPRSMQFSLKLIF